MVEGMHSSHSLYKELTGSRVLGRQSRKEKGKRMFDINTMKLKKNLMSIHSSQHNGNTGQKSPTSRFIFSL